MFTVTYRYSAINQHDARYNLARAYPGGIEALAARMQMSSPVMRNKLAPGIHSHHINDEEDSLIIEYSVEARVPDPYRALIAKNFRHGLIAFPMPSIDHMSDQDLTQLLCRVMKEVGEVMASASAALADGRITSQELDDLEKEIQEAMAAIVELRERYRARADGAGPSLHAV